MLKALVCWFTGGHPWGPWVLSDHYSREGYHRKTRYRRCLSCKALQVVESEMTRVG